MDILPLNRLSEATLVVSLVRISQGLCFIEVTAETCYHLRDLPSSSTSHSTTLPYFTLLKLLFTSFVFVVFLYR